MQKGIQNTRIIKSNSDIHRIEIEFISKEGEEKK